MKQAGINHVIKSLTDHNIRFDKQEFTSGAVMIDIWIHNHFYVIQFNDNTWGVSKIDDDPAFDTIPDEVYFDNDTFFRRFNQIIIDSVK